MPFVQHSDIPGTMGCELNEQGYLKVDLFQKTNVPGIFACGYNGTFIYSVSNAVASDGLAGNMSNKETIDKEF